MHPSDEGASRAPSAKLARYAASACEALVAKCDDSIVEPPGYKWLIFLSLQKNYYSQIIGRQNEIYIQKQTQKWMEWCVFCTQQR